jgi:hypothetical protein
MIDRTHGLLFCISPDSTRAGFTAAMSPATTASAPVDLSAETAAESGARKHSVVSSPIAPNDGGAHWVVQRTFSYTDAFGHTLTAEEGFSTDGALPLNGITFGITRSGTRASVTAVFRSQVSYGRHDVLAYSYNPVCDSALTL